MQKQNSKARAFGQMLSVAIVSVLFGSTLILSAVGPARASEAPASACYHSPAALPYLA